MKKRTWNKKNTGKFSPSYVFLNIIYLFGFASFSNTLPVFFQVAAFYQIWQACVFHDTLPQPSDLWYQIDIFPLCSPTFLVFKENLFNKYNIPYFTELNLNSLILTKTKRLPYSYMS